jgi:hypothetical protein
MANNSLRYIDTPRLSKAFKPCRDNNGVTEEVAFFYHQVAKIDPNAHYDVAIVWQSGIRSAHRLLKLDGACNCVDGAGEFREHPIAHQLHDSAIMLDNKGLEDVLAPGLEYGQRTSLVLLNEPAVANYICGEDGGEATLNAFFSHWRGYFQETQ